VERRWKLIRELGSGAYGVVMFVFILGASVVNHVQMSGTLDSSAADEISGETVAIKMVTRVFDKIQLAKRALREIMLLRHFASHENITGLIDVDAISPNFNEMCVGETLVDPINSLTINTATFSWRYVWQHLGGSSMITNHSPAANGRYHLSDALRLFLSSEVLSTADLYQIIKSGQSLTNEHVQYFLYQILRGSPVVLSPLDANRHFSPSKFRNEIHPFSLRHPQRSETRKSAGQRRLRAQNM